MVKAKYYEMTKWKFAWYPFPIELYSEVDAYAWFKGEGLTKTTKQSRNR